MDTLTYSAMALFRMKRKLYQKHYKNSANKTEPSGLSASTKVTASRSCSKFLHQSWPKFSFISESRQTLSFKIMASLQRQNLDQKSASRDPK